MKNMKSRFILMSLAAAAMTMVSCVKDNIDNAVVSEVTLNAVTEGGQTKTALTGFADVVWSAGDQIAVYTGTAFKDFTLASGEGTASASFSGALAAGETAVGAVYPAAAKGADMGTVKYPAEYTYSEMGVNAPMVAEVAEGVLEFKHVGGVVKFDVGNIPPTAAGFVFTANSKITGDFTVTSGAVATSGTTAESVKISFTAGSIKSATFMVPLPTGTYNGFSVKFVDASGAEITGTAKVKNDYSFIITRAKLLAFPGFVDTTTPAKITLWEGENTYGEWSNALQYFAYGGPVPNLAGGDILKFYYTATEVAGMSFANPNDWATKYYVNYNISPSNTVLDVVVTDEMASAIKESNGFIIEGNKFTLTKIELLAPTAPETVLWTGEFGDFTEWQPMGVLPMLPTQIKPGTILGCYFEHSSTTGWGNVNLGYDENSSFKIVTQVQLSYGKTYGEIVFTEDVLSQFADKEISIVLQNAKLHKLVIK